jgi:hypothetical protein
MISSCFEITKIIFTSSMMIMYFTTLKVIIKIFINFTLYSIDCFHEFIQVFYNLLRKDYFNYQLLKILTIH